MCKVSIVIPICNVEDYVKTCVESVMQQTLQDIEIICIDDASTDGSLEIVQECAKNDARITVIAYDTNKSASQARKDGALQAKGEYIIFLDGDDYLEQNACENLYRAISKKNVDILQFGTNVINEGNVPERRIKNMLKFLKPYKKLLRGKDVFEGCFIENYYRFTLWNKIYKGSLCKKAFEHVKDGNFPKAQDLYAFFLLCYFAESYYGIEDSYYNYRFGAGISGREELSLSQFERYCHSAYVADAMADFISEQGAAEYTEVTDTLRANLLRECLNSWFSYISSDESARGFDILLKYWNRTEIVTGLCKWYRPQRKLLAEKINGAESIQNKTQKPIKTIGIFYYRYAPGGVQRVISLLIPMYMQMGYQVVLFTDEFSEENEYALPEGATRVILPSSLQLAKNEYRERAETFLAKIEEYKIDIICYQAASSGMLLFDMLLLKLHQVPVILTVHEVAFQNLLTMNAEMTNRPAIYRLADCVTVLSRADQKYWNCFGVNAIYIPNPIENRLIQRDLARVEKNTILWIGRLDPRTKCCFDIVDIMKHVVNDIPDAKLLVVGDDFSPGTREKMERSVVKNKLENHIIFCGYDTDVDPYYRRSELHILTSISETFPMTIAESKSYGMPLVMYELPFIEFARDPRGFASVPQGDTKMMAKAIVRILSSEEDKVRMQKEAHDSLKDFLAVDLKEEWEKIFSALWNNTSRTKEDETTSILLRSFLHHYTYGVAANNNQKRLMQKKSSDAKKIKLSLDYRIGHAIMFIPHAIARLFKKAARKI